MPSSVLCPVGDGHASGDRRDRHTGGRDHHDRQRPLSGARHDPSRLRRHQLHAGSDKAPGAAAPSVPGRRAAAGRAGRRRALGALATRPPPGRSAFASYRRARPTPPRPSPYARPARRRGPSRRACRSRRASHRHRWRRRRVLPTAGCGSTATVDLLDPLPRRLAPARRPQHRRRRRAAARRRHRARPRPDGYGDETQDGCPTDGRTRHVPRRACSWARTSDSGTLQHEPRRSSGPAHRHRLCLGARASSPGHRCRVRSTRRRRGRHPTPTLGGADPRSASCAIQPGGLTSQWAITRARRAPHRRVGPSASASASRGPRVTGADVTTVTSNRPDRPREQRGPFDIAAPAPGRPAGRRFARLGTTANRHGPRHAGGRLHRRPAPAIDRLSGRTGRLPRRRLRRRRRRRRPRQQPAVQRHLPGQETPCAAAAATTDSTAAQRRRPRRWRQERHDDRPARARTRPLGALVTTRSRRSQRQRRRRSSTAAGAGTARRGRSDRPAQALRAHHSPRDPAQLFRGRDGTTKPTEREGFEPSNEVNPRYAISSRARSTAPAPLQAPEASRPGDGCA